ncbi:hypothetical protein ACHAPJ_009661 [Fusarium lateritium]
MRINAARSWNKWDLTIGAIEPDVDTFKKIDDDDWSLSHARLEAHYIVHRSWLEEDQLLNPKNLDKIRHIPLTIVQGRYDIICPPRTAWELHISWPGSSIFLIPRSGHSAAEPGIYNKLIEVCDKYGRS